jgi:hypothetical protein
MPGTLQLIPQEKAKQQPLMNHARDHVWPAKGHEWQVAVSNQRHPH